MFLIQLQNLVTKEVRDLEVHVIPQIGESVSFRGATFNVYSVQHILDPEHDEDVVAIVSMRQSP